MCGIAILAAVIRAVARPGSRTGVRPFITQFQFPERAGFCRWFFPDPTATDLRTAINAAALRGRAGLPKSAAATPAAETQ